MNEKILAILKDIRPEFDFETSEDFIEDGYLDSFDIVTLVSELEDTFGVLIDGLAILPENFNTVEAIAGVISNSEKG